MARYILSDTGEIVRESDTAGELDVQEIPPQLVRFQYAGVSRIAQIVTIRASRGHYAPNLLVALELWNSRDDFHPEAQVKTFTLEQIIGLENV